MYMPLGQAPEHRPQPGAMPCGVRAGDVERFRLAMKGGAQRLHSPGLPGPLSLWRREGADEQNDQDDREHRDDALEPGFADAIERLWVGEGLHAEREVRIGLHNRILPGTAVRMRMVQGAIHIDLTCAEPQTATRLAGRLEFLVAELGARLGGALVATVEQVDRGVVRSIAWYPGR
jgi:hypothetical protein